MKKLVVFFISLAAIASCKNPKHATEVNTIRSLDPLLNGAWQLKSISAQSATTDELYPDKKPTLSFDVPAGNISGNTSCNNFSAKLQAENNTISFKSPMAMTKMACAGKGEATFLDALKKVDKYSISGDTTLNLITGDVAVLQFVKQK